MPIRMLRRLVHTKLGVSAFLQAFVKSLCSCCVPGLDFSSCGRQHDNKQVTSLPPKYQYTLKDILGQKYGESSVVKQERPTCLRPEG